MVNSIEKLQQARNLVATLINSNQELFTLRVARSYKATLMKMVITLLATGSITVSRVHQFALLRTTATRYGGVSWQSAMNTFPIWMAQMGHNESGTAADFTVIAPSINEIIDWSKENNVMLDVTGTRSNQNAGWVFIGRASQTSSTIEGGVVIFYELEWLGGNGGGAHWQFVDDGDTLYNDENNDSGAGAM